MEKREKRILIVVSIAYLLFLIIGLLFHIYLNYCITVDMMIYRCNFDLSKTFLSFIIFGLPAWLLLLVVLLSTTKKPAAVKHKIKY